MGDTKGGMFLDLDRSLEDPANVRLFQDLFRSPMTNYLSLAKQYQIIEIESR